MLCCLQTFVTMKSPDDEDVEACVYIRKY